MLSPVLLLSCRLTDSTYLPVQFFSVHVVCCLSIRHAIGAVPAKGWFRTTSITTFKLHPSIYLQPRLILSKSKPDVRKGHVQTSAYHSFIQTCLRSCSAVVLFILSCPGWTVLKLSLGPFLPTTLEVFVFLK